MVRNIIENINVYFFWVSETLIDFICVCVVEIYSDEGGLVSLIKCK